MSSELATIGSTQMEGAAVVTVQGEIDMSNADRLLDALMSQLGTAPWVVVDLSRCSYVDSAGLGVIARVDARCRSKGVGFRVVVEPAGSVDRVLSMTNMRDVVMVDDRLSDALRAVLDDAGSGSA